jgi:hypothetical protein
VYKLTAKLPDGQTKVFQGTFQECVDQSVSIRLENHGDIIINIVEVE